MIRVHLGSYLVSLEEHQRLGTSGGLAARCVDVEEVGAGRWFSLRVSHEDLVQPILDFGRRLQPAGGGFEPGVLLVPETSVLFVGGGDRVWAFDLEGGCRLWEQEAEFGFWGWERSDGVVLMAAELAFAAWDVSGTKLWETFVEPPWVYRVDRGEVELDVMGSVRRFDLRRGPEAPPWTDGEKIAWFGS